MRGIAFSTALLLLAASTSPAAAQTKLDVAYAVYLAGLPVGRATVTVDVSENGFAAWGSAKTSGFIRLISKGEGSANVRTTTQGNRITASNFSGRLVTSRREQKLELGVVNGCAKEVSVEPERLFSEDRVPITKEAKTNVVDPLSAMLALIPGKGDMLAPESCNRTVPIFDGRYRFNLVLSYVRTEQAPAAAEGYQGQAIVCRARYVPVAGHHADGEQVKQMSANREMFVWLAPISGTRVLAPIKASIASPIGTFSVEATRFSTSR